jgi:diamine N-acetyltransferase
MSHPDPAPDAPVTLREVTRDNLGDVLRLKVTEEQRNFVADNATSIAQAHFYPEMAWFRAIYAGETPVGFLMLADEAEKQEYFLWRFMIDARYQGRGYGRRALELLVEHVRTRPGAAALGVSYVPGEGSPGPFYHRFGFADTGEVDDGENVALLNL